MATLRQQADKSETNGHTVNEASRVPASIFALIVFFLASSLLIGQAINEPGPHPSRIAATAQTPDLIQQQMHIEARQREFNWAARIARFIYRAHGCNDSFAELTAENALAFKLPVRLIAAVVVVESTCRPWIVSSEGAVGLMQIVPAKWHVSRSELKNPAFNLRKGSEILSRYVRKFGVYQGLHGYNGFGIGCPTCDSNYPDRVLAVAGLKKVS